MTYYPQPGFQQPTGMRHAIQPGQAVMRPMGQTVQSASMAGPYQVYNPSQHSGQPMYAAINQYHQNSLQQINVAAQGQPAQYQNAPRMTAPQQFTVPISPQQPQQQQPQQQLPVYAYIQQPLQTTAPNGAVFGANNQFQQQMTVAPPQPNFVSNQTMPVNHHYPAPALPTASVPPKREEKPSTMVNPDTKEVVNAVVTGDRENFIAHHTPERTTPQSTPPPPADEIKAQFATHIVAQLKKPSESEGSNSLSNKSTGYVKCQEALNACKLSEEYKKEAEENEEGIGSTSEFEMCDGTEPRFVKSKSVDFKYHYKIDQRSPMYPESKKQYDRDFLLQFQANSVNKPIGLPNIPDIILDSPIESCPLSLGIVFIPSFVRNIYASNEGGYKPHPGGLGSARKSNAIKAIIDTDAPAAGEEVVYGKVCSLLNKMTPQNFKTLMGQLKNLELNTEQRLNKTLDIIFEKAVSEPNSSVAYAHVCKFMTDVKVPLADKPNEIVGFRKLLLKKCQSEFERDIDEIDLKKLQKQIDEADEEDQKQKLKEAKIQTEEKFRRRLFGTIRFIGELFKLKMLVEAIMHDYICKLLKNGDEESLECLCGLLCTIGKDLDTEKARRTMDTYFQRMDKIVEQKKIQMRVRFMLQDIIELRKSAWVPRQADNNLEKNEQIHPRSFLGGQGQQGGFQGVEDDCQTARGRRGSMEMQQPIKKTKKVDIITAPIEVHRGRVLNVGELKKIISDTNRENDDVFSWLESHVEIEVRSQLSFVRDLTFALFSGAAVEGDDNYSIAVELMKKRSTVLQKYLDHKTDLELHALYALQALVHELKHPSGMLITFFNTLFEENVISEDAFIQWEKNEDSAWQQGRGDAKMSVVQFFTWLEEAKEELEKAKRITN